MTSSRAPTLYALRKAKWTGTSTQVPVRPGMVGELGMCGRSLFGNWELSWSASDSTRAAPVRVGNLRPRVLRRHRRKIKQLQVEADNLVIAIIHQSEHEEFDETVRMSFSFALDHLRFAIAARRAAILDRIGGGTARSPPRERRELPPVAAGMRRTPLMGRVFTSLPCTYSSFRALEMCRPLHLPSAVSRSARTRKALRQAKRIIRIKEEHDVLAEMAVIPTTIRCLSRAQPSHTDQPGAGTRSRRVSP